MKKLLLMRHAKSSWDNDKLSDYERPLNERGLKDAPRMGKLLKHKDLIPDAIVTSSAARAAATAELVALALDFEGTITYTDRLYHAEPDTFLTLARGLSDSVNCALLIGHNPGLEELVERLCGRAESMPTAAVACFDLSIAEWKDLSRTTTAALVAVWRPKEL